MNTTGPTTLAHRIAEYVGYQLATRPRLRRAVTFWLTTQVLGTWAVAAAPAAAAATLGGALNWTGVTDSHGVPVGNYYLSVVSTSEAITNGGPELTADPESWARWLAGAVTTGLTHQAVVELLQLQAGIYIFMITTALWLMRFAMSNTWLYWLATWFRPLFEVIRTLLNDLGVFPLCMLAGLAVGAHHILWHGRKGHGAGIMLSTFIIGIIGLVITRDPLTELYDENGLLGRARNLGFQTAQAFANNGPVTAGGTNAQLHHLTGLIADATLRMPLQLMNFGAPIDDIGTCGTAYTTAILAGKPDGPAHAMRACGAGQALAFAQQLSGANLALGLFYLLLGAVFAFFVCYVTYSYVMVCCAAFFNALFVVVAAAPAMIHGQPRQRALRRFKLFFKHAAMVFVYTTYISVAAMIVLKMAARSGYADQVGMTHPLAHLVMIALTSVVAIGGLWWLKRELGDHTRHDLTHIITSLAREASFGYVRGQFAQKSRKPRQRPSDTPRSGAHPLNDNSDGNDPDQPLTGPPAKGRPPGGGPPSPGRRSRSPAGSSPQGAPIGGVAPATGRAKVPRASQFGDAAAPTAAETDAVATVIAPEVVAGAAIASQIAQRQHRTSGQRSSAHQPLPADSGGGPAAAADVPRPVTGRANTSGPVVEAPASGLAPGQTPAPVPDAPSFQAGDGPNLGRRHGTTDGRNPRTSQHP